MCNKNYWMIRKRDATLRHNLAVEKEKYFLHKGQSSLVCCRSFEWRKDLIFTLQLAECLYSGLCSLAYQIIAHVHMHRYVLLKKKICPFIRYCEFIYFYFSKISHFWPCVKNFTSCTFIRYCAVIRKAKMQPR